jgi:hypothetical protein
MLMRIGLVIALLCAAATAPAVGDVVLMNSGKVYHGQVSRKGDKVLIKTSMATIAVNAADVRRIIRTAPTTQPEAPTPEVPTPVARLPGEDLARPECFAFLTIRQLEATPGGMASFQLRQRLKSWRVKVHDRERKVGSRWLTPKDVAKCRQDFLDLVKKTSSTVRDIRRTSTTSPEGRAKRVRYKRALSRQLRSAASAWADPLLRDFLVAAAYLEGLYYKQAMAQFQRCRKATPRIAAFRQGEGLALAGMDRKLEALSPYMEVLRLRPDSRDALDLLLRGLRETPGDQMDKPAYLAARDMLDSYERPSGRSYTRSGTSWLMPGRPWVARENTIPTPPCDRLVFRRGVGVPVSKQALLVDRQTVHEALEVFVRIDAQTLIPAAARRVSTFGRKTPPLPLALVTVRDCEFQSLGAGGEAKFAKGLSVMSYGLPLYQEMGSQIRPIPAKIAKVDPNGVAALSENLVAGEAAGPILTKDGVLAGFLVGKTDPMVDGAGPNRVIPLSRLDELIKRASRGYSSYTGYRRVKRKIEPKAVTGRFFVVLAVAAEAPPKRR